MGADKIDITVGSADVPTETGPESEPAPAPAPKPKKVGLLDRLLGLGPKPPALNIAIGPFVDGEGTDHARDIVQVFQDLKGVRAKAVKEPPLMNPDEDRRTQLPAACSQAMQWIDTHKADLVIWGDIPAPGTTLYIHFAAAPPIDSDPAAGFSPFQALTLPVGYDPELSGILLASALAAMHPETTEKFHLRHALVADALEQATQGIELLPRDLTTREKAAVYAAYANALATFAHLFPGTEIWQRASMAYAQALKGTSRTESPTNWAYLQKSSGSVLQALGERGDGDMDSLERAASAYRHALEVFSPDKTPFPWAATSSRLADVLYRIDIKSGEIAGLKEALTHVQSALKVFSKKRTPQLWAEALNSLAQVAQVLGREMDNPEVVERAVAACRSALEVRDRTKSPTHWAGIQNNLGSALFLLGRMTNEENHYEAALEAFMAARDVYAELGLTRMAELTEKNMAHAEGRIPGRKTGNGGSDGDQWWREGDEEEEAPPPLPPVVEDEK